MTITPSYVATQARSGLSNTLSFPERKHPISPRPSTYLKLCDSSVADLSSRGCIFTSIESFHFVVQLSDKVYLQRAGAWGGVHTEREGCTVHSATTKRGKSVILQQQQWWWWWWNNVSKAGVTNSRAKWGPVLPFCRALGNDRVTFSSSFW